VIPDWNYSWGSNEHSSRVSGGDPEIKEMKELTGKFFSLL